MTKRTRRDVWKAATLAGLAGVTAGLPEVVRGQMQDETKPRSQAPSEVAALQAAQGEANSKPGPRSVPAKVIPVPNHVDPATAALVAAPTRGSGI
jgi:hypothetical protein